MKQLDLNLQFPTISEILDFSPVCGETKYTVSRFYNTFFYNKGVCIHYKGKRFHVMCYNFVPSFLHEFNSVRQTDNWFSIFDSQSLNDCFHFYRLAVRDLFRFLDKSEEEKKVDLASIISDLQLFAEVNGYGL